MTCAVLLGAACGFEVRAGSDTAGDGGPVLSDGRGTDVLGLDARQDDAQPDAPTNPCPGSYNLTFGAHRYRASTVGSRAAVHADCTNDGQHIVKIESAPENEFVRSTLATASAGGSYFWIGLTWDGSRWAWDDGAALGAYENFAGPAPTGGSSPCVDVSYGSGAWSEYQCTTPPHDTLCECDGS